MKTKPIFGTDLSKPPHILIEEIRSQIAILRGQLGDIGREYTGWQQQIRDVEGLLTCGLVDLHYTAEDMKILNERRIK